MVPCTLSKVRVVSKTSFKRSKKVFREFGYFEHEKEAEELLTKGIIYSPFPEDHFFGYPFLDD